MFIRDLFFLLSISIFRFYHEKDVDFIIHWKLLVCIKLPNSTGDFHERAVTDKQFYIIKSLMNECRYSVSVRAERNFVPSKKINLNLNVPSCDKILNSQFICPHVDYHIDLNCKTIIKAGSVMANVTWLIKNYRKFNLTKVRLSWNEMDKKNTFVQVLPITFHYFLLSNLKSDTVYNVKFQTFGKYPKAKICPLKTPFFQLETTTRSKSTENLLSRSEASTLYVILSTFACFLCISFVKY